MYAHLKKLHNTVLDLSGPMWNWPSVLTMTRPSLARVLYLNDLYKKIIEVPGVICEFGTHFGTTAAIMTNLRALNEPFNYSRVLYLFDTFTGFVGTTSADANSGDGDFALPIGYELILDEVLTTLESMNPNSHIKQHKIYKGDASLTVHDFLRDSPHAVVAMAIFDMDIYRPTYEALSALLPRLVKGSVIVFDELNHPEFPGETMAVQEICNLNHLKLRRNPMMPFCSWACFGD